MGDQTEYCHYLGCNFQVGYRVGVLICHMYHRPVPKVFKEGFDFVMIQVVQGCSQSNFSAGWTFGQPSEHSDFS